jgi:hypothetical protein
MQIKAQIKQARNIVFLQDVGISLLWVGIIGSILFLIGIELESVFYFLPKIKVPILILLTGSFSFISIFWVIQYYRSESDQIHRYKIETLSLQLGQTAFPKKQDTILNALQLESGSRENESKELANSYIEKISNKLKELDYPTLLINENLKDLKHGLLATWIICIIVFSLTYQNSANAFYRWQNPKTEKYELWPAEKYQQENRGHFHVKRYDPYRRNFFSSSGQIM